MATEDNKPIAELQAAYKTLGWLKWFFPKRIAIALLNTKATSTEQKNEILYAVTQTHWLWTSLFRSLRTFTASALFRAYQCRPKPVISPPGSPEESINRMSTLPSTLLSSGGIGAFLSQKDQLELALTDTHFSALFTDLRKNHIIKKLLTHVVFGEQNEAETMLRKSPELLTRRGKITDDAGRTFANISPWEYMLWSLDTRYMGQMMLHCIPEGIKGDAIRRECVAQYEAMQAGGRDLVKMDRNPSDMPLGELQAFLARLGADNKDVLLYHWDAVSDTDCFYYYNDNTVSVFEYHFMAEKNAAFMALFHRMDMNSAKKSNDAEHALITTAAGITLSRKGIRYEQPAAYKPLVKLDGTIDPQEMDFADIARLFETTTRHALPFWNDALLFWNDQTYYVDKATSTVTKIEPKHDLSSEESTALSTLQATVACMPYNLSRGPRTLEEYQHINTLFRGRHPAFHPTHHCEGHYDFAIIDALDLYFRNDPLDRILKSALWMMIGKTQRQMPAHVIQHYCDPDKRFYPEPDFRAKEFKRTSCFYHLSWIARPEPEHHGSNIHGEIRHLFPSRTSGAYHFALGFTFGLTRGDDPFCLGIDVSQVETGNGDGILDANALIKLYQVRTEDAKQLHNDLQQLISTEENSYAAISLPNISTLY